MDKASKSRRRTPVLARGLVALRTHLLPALVPSPEMLLTVSLAFCALCLIDTLSRAPSTPFPSEVELEAMLYFGPGETAEAQPLAGLDSGRDASDEGLKVTTVHAASTAEAVMRSREDRDREAR